MVRIVHTFSKTVSPLISCENAQIELIHSPSACGKGLVSCMQCRLTPVVNWCQLMATLRRPPRFIAVHVCFSICDTWAMPCSMAKSCRPRLSNSFVAKMTACGMLWLWFIMLEKAPVTCCCEMWSYPLVTKVAGNGHSTDGAKDEWQAVSLLLGEKGQQLSTWTHLLHFFLNACSSAFKFLSIVFCTLSNQMASVVLVCQSGMHNHLVHWVWLGWKQTYQVPGELVLHQGWNSIQMQRNNLSLGWVHHLRHVSIHSTNLHSFACHIANSPMSFHHQLQTSVLSHQWKHQCWALFQHGHQDGVLSTGWLHCHTHKWGCHWLWSSVCQNHWHLNQIHEMDGLWSQNCVPQRLWTCVSWSTWVFSGLQHGAWCNQDAHVVVRSWGCSGFQWCNHDMLWHHCWGCQCVDISCRWHHRQWLSCWPHQQCHNLCDCCLIHLPCCHILQQHSSMIWSCEISVWGSDQPPWHGLCMGSEFLDHHAASQGTGSKCCSISCAHEHVMLQAMTGDKQSSWHPCHIEFLCHLAPHHLLTVDMDLSAMICKYWVAHQMDVLKLIHTICNIQCHDLPDSCLPVLASVQDGIACVWGGAWCSDLTWVNWHQPCHWGLHHWRVKNYSG